MDFDNILEEIGEFGRFQKKIYFLLCIPMLVCAMNSYSYIFTAGQQNYRCVIPECDSRSGFFRYRNEWTEFAIPGKFDSIGNYQIENCLKYKPIQNITDLESNNFCSTMIFSNETESCDNWIFDEQETTIVKDFEITCPGNQWKLALVGTIHFLGYLSGSFWILLGDYLGRKRAMLLSVVFMSISGTLQGLSTNYSSFVIFKFLNAVGNAGMYPLGFVIAIELVGKHKRHTTGIIINYFYAIGEALLGMLAWIAKDWRMLQILISAPALLFMFYYWFIPESVRWLLVKNRSEDAIKIITKAAKVNKVDLSSSTLASFKENLNQDAKSNVNSISYLQTIGKMLSTKIMAKRLLILIFIWAVNALVYNGLSLNSVSLSGNKYLNFILVSLVEIPGYAMTWLFINSLGRRKSTLFTMVLCGATCIFSGYISITWLQVCMFLIGKWGISMSFTIIYIHTSEMMPTSLRSSGVAIMATAGRLTSTITPMVPLLALYYKPLPFLVYGFLPIIGGFLAMFLPETSNRKLPDTIEDAMKMKFEKHPESKIRQETKKLNEKKNDSSV